MSPADRRHPARPGRVSADHLQRIVLHLTERDRRIALDCYDHRVLTTAQLRRLHFGSLRVTQRRLGELYELRILDRFRRPWQHGDGSSPYHWLLDEAGAHVVAERLELERDALRWRRDTALALARSDKLAHQIEVNEFFSRLAADARAAGGRLHEWWGERRCRDALGETVTPDGYGRVELPGRSITFLLELDRGTENHERLREKARRYDRALGQTCVSDAKPTIILAVPSPARAARARETLASGDAAITPIVWLAAAGMSPLPVVVATSSLPSARNAA
jgi:Replication-relaxation